MDPVQRVLAIGVEVQGTCTHGVLWATRHTRRERAEALLLTGSWDPIRPLGHIADLGDAGPVLRLLAHRDPVTDRLMVLLDKIEIAVIGIDDDRPGRLSAVIVHNVPLERLRNGGLSVRRSGEQFLVAGFERCRRRRLKCCLHAAAEQQSNAKEYKLPGRHHPPLRPRTTWSTYHSLKE